MKLLHCMGVAAALMSSSALASPLATVERNGSYVSVEPFAPNIVHVTMALEPDLLDKQPHYGIVATSNTAAWTHATGDDGDRFSSGALTLTVDTQRWPKAPDQMAHYFHPSLPPVSLSIADGAGRPLLRMPGWATEPQTVNGER